MLRLTAAAIERSAICSPFCPSPKTASKERTATASRRISVGSAERAWSRKLERDLSKVCRKVVKSLVVRPRKNKMIVNEKNLDKFLGVRRYSYGIAEKENQVGQVTGLAWTEVGGELLTIEAVILPGKGNTMTTGKLGDVMQESIKAALSVVRKRSKSLGIKEDFYQSSDIHIHLPARRRRTAPRLASAFALRSRLP